MNNSGPKVSVLIPAYNSEKFIRRTVDSVLRQTFSDLEIIVVDDGSGDATANIIRELRNRDSRIKYFYQENRGLSNTRNRLVDLARGEFVAFLDHDDEWLAEKLDEQLCLFTNNKDLGLVFSDAYIRNNGRIVGTCFKQRRPFRGDVFYRYLFSDNFVPLPTVLIHKNVIREVMPFNAGYEMAEEFDVFVKIARKYKFDYLNKPLAIYNLHNDNQVFSKWRKVIDEDFAILDYWRKIDGNIDNLYRRSLNKRIAQLYCIQARCLLGSNLFAEAGKAILNSFQHRLFNYDAFRLFVKFMFNRAR